VSRLTVTVGEGRTSLGSSHDAYHPCPPSGPTGVPFSSRIVHSAFWS